MNNLKHDIFQPEIKVKGISIENFRGFENIELAFQPDLTVLIGENGAGKTAVLDCLASLLRLVEGQINPNTLKKNEKWLDLLDIKEGQFKTSNQLDLLLGHTEIKCNMAFNNNQFQHDSVSPSIAGIIEKLHHKKTVNLPLLVYYPASNAPVNRIDFNNANDLFETNRLSAYKGALDKNAFDFINFFNWYKWQENIERQIGENKTLDAVREAIYKLLSDEHNTFEKLSINWLNNPNGEMMISKGETPLNINQLSSGEKTLLALVADLARRLAIANPHRQNPLMGYGIVLIDEIDLHLHPRWQRGMIPQLQKTFPNCQLIVTTHSPLVLSQIAHKKVIILEDFQAVKTPPPTFGRDNNSILYDLMGVKQRPDEIQQQLDTVYDLIDEGKKGEAQTLLKRLSQDLGENDMAIVQAYVSLDFMDIDDETN